MNMAPWTIPAAMGKKSRINTGSKEKSPNEALSGSWHLRATPA